MLRAFRHKGLVLGGVLSLAIVLAGIFAPLVAPHDPTTQHLRHRLAGPSLEFPLGTDSLGRCLASRLIYGIRPSIGLAVAVTAVVVAMGTLVGVAAALFRRLDPLLMRVTDAFFSLPSMVLALVVISIIGPGAVGILLALAVPGWPKYARVVRSVAITQMALPHVEAVRAMGAGRGYVTRTCLLPPIWPQMATIATLGIGGKIASIAGLGFLGLGIQPPTPEWGAIMVHGLPMLGTAPHVTVFSGMAIALTVLAFTLLGEGLQDVADPFSTRLQEALPDGVI